MGFDIDLDMMQKATTIFFNLSFSLLLFLRAYISR